MLDAVRDVLAGDSRIAYALVFGSVARGRAAAHSDLDVAIGLAAGARLSVGELGDLASLLEHAAGRPVDLVLLDEAPPALAYRVFRDGQSILEADRDAMARRRTKAILEYLDFEPIEAICARGAIRAAAEGR